MNVILISIDGGVFDPASAVRARMIEYASEVDQLDVVCISRDPKARSETIAPHCTLHAISVSKLIAPFKLFETLMSLAQLRRRRDTIISSQDPFILGFVALCASAAAKVPLQVQVHIDFFSQYFSKESWRQRIEASLAPFVLARATRIRVVSRKIADYCEQGLGISKELIDVIPIRSRLESIEKAEPGTSATVLVAARFVKQKNIPLAIRAFAEAAQILKDITMLIMGSGPEESTIRAEIRSVIHANPSLENRITVQGWSSNLGGNMKGSKVFVLSSDYEGWGMTAVEASAAGTAVIMTDVGCAGEFVVSNETGVVVPVRDQQALAAAILKLCGDEEVRGGLVTRAQAKAKTLESLEEYNRAIVQSWKQTLS